MHDISFQAISCSFSDKLNDFARPKLENCLNQCLQCLKIWRKNLIKCFYTNIPKCWTHSLLSRLCIVTFMFFLTVETSKKPSKFTVMNMNITIHTWLIMGRLNCILLHNVIGMIKSLFLKLSIIIFMDTKMWSRSENSEVSGQIARMYRVTWFYTGGKG